MSNSNDLRVYAAYYSKKNQMYLKGQVVRKLGNNRVLFRPVNNKNIGMMKVPVAMLECAVLIDDSGLVKKIANI